MCTESLLSLCKLYLDGVHMSIYLYVDFATNIAKEERVPESEEYFSLIQRLKCLSFRSDRVREEEEDLQRRNAVAQELMQSLSLIHI